MRNRLRSGDTGWNNGRTLGAGELTFDNEAKALRIHNGASLGGYEVIGERALKLGPGPQELVAGTMEAGFFGELSSEDFYSGSGLQSEIGLTAGSLINDAVGWLKFAYQGTILFIAKKPISVSLSWGDIYQAGAVYGTDGPGPYPANTDVNQLTILEHSGDSFICRLLTGADADPTDRELQEVPSPGISSEWDDLIVAVVMNWGIYTSTELGSYQSVATWCQESILADTDSKVHRGSRLQQFNYREVDYSAATLGWRPVLELIQ